MQTIISDQLSNLAFFHLICTCYQTLDKRVYNYHELGNHVHQIDQHHCVWSYSGNGVANIHFQISEFSLGLTSSFNIIGILHKLNLNGFGGRKWNTKVEMDNE